MFLLEHQAPAKVIRRLEELLAEEERVEGTVFKRHAVLEVGKDQQHFWSPHLYLEAREDEDAPSALHGRFAPHPHVWGMFMAVYGVLLMGGIAGLVWGIAQSMLGEAPWGFAFFPAALALIGFVYGATLIGQGLGAEQMYELRAFVDRAAAKHNDR